MHEPATRCTSQAFAASVLPEFSTGAISRYYFKILVIAVIVVQPAAHAEGSRLRTCAHLGIF